MNKTRDSGRREETNDLVSSNNQGHPGDYLMALTRVTLNLGTESDCKSRTCSPKFFTFELSLSHCKQLAWCTGEHCHGTGLKQKCYSLYFSTFHYGIYTIFST